MPEQLKILFLSTWFPYPPDQGSKIRAYYLLKAMAEVHRVTLISFEDVEIQPAWRAHIAGICEKVITLPRPPFAADRLRTALGLLSPLPSAVVGMYSDEMAALTAETAREWLPDIVVALTFVTAPYALKANAPLRVVDIDNYLARMLYEAIASASTASARVRRWVAYKKCRAYERKIYSKFNLSLAVTAADRDRVLDELMLRSEQVVITPNGVDTDYNHLGISRPVAGVLTYNGAVTYSANLDAVKYFMIEIMPQVRGRQPATRLQVTGRNSGVDLTGIPMDAMEFTGYVEDIRPVVAGSWATVIPLRMGGGTRLKVLEAMALGTPVVSTPKGVEGLDLRAGEHYLLGRDSTEFANSTVELLESPELRTRLSECSSTWVRQHYEWAEIGAEFRSIVEERFEVIRGEKAGNDV